MPTSALKTKLVTTGEAGVDTSKWDKIVRYALDRIAGMKNREQTDWWQEREQAEAVRGDDYSHRLSGDNVEAQTIFDRSNETLGMDGTICEFIVARMRNTLFATSPWMDVKPQGRLDRALAEQILPYAEWKLKQANYPSAIKEALEDAVWLGEAPVKTTWRVITHRYEEVRTVLVRANGEPVLTPEGGYIYEDATRETVDMAVPMEDGAGGVVVDEATGQPVLAPGQVEMIGGVPAEDGMDWQERAIERTEREYAGLHVAPLYWKDVLWDVEAAEPEDDFIAHRYDHLSPEELRVMLDPDLQDEDIASACRALMQDDPTAKAEASKPADGSTGTDRVGEAALPRPKITECYFKYANEDVFGDPLPRRIWLVLHEETSTAVYGDYMAAISPWGKPCVRIIPFNKKSKRKQGVGIPKLIAMANTLADRLANGLVFDNYKRVCPPTISRAGAVKEWDKTGVVAFQPNRHYIAENSQVPLQNLFYTLETPDLNQRTWDIVMLMLQLIQARTGVTNAAQAAASQLPQNGTATGMNQLAEISGLLHQQMLESAKDHLGPQLSDAIELVFFRLDRDEVFEFLEGEADRVLTLADAMVLRKLRMNVEIRITRARNQQMREAIVASIPVVWQWWQLYRADPEAARKTKQLVVKGMKAVEIDDADEYFPSDEDIDALLMAQAQAQAQAAEAEAAAVEGEAAPALPANVEPAPEPAPTA